MTLGKVWLVGAGPGEPGLITVRGLEVLSQADVVLYDALAHPSLLDACPDADRRYVGKRYAFDNPPQAGINQQLIDEAKKGKKVVRLKGGDPFLFARGAEEAEALAEAGVPFEIVPGVPSPVAAAAYAGMSLTHRDLSSSTTFITGSDKAGKEWSPDAWKKLATATDTICVLMGMRRIAEITQAIIDGGRDPNTPAAVIQWGARPEQRVEVGTVSDIAERARARGLSNPAIIVVGKIVALRKQLCWYDSRPLFGKRILVPRPAHQAKATAEAVRSRSAKPVVFPVIEIVDPPDIERLYAAARQVQSYDWVLFTSANGVERFFAALAHVGRDARAFAGAKIGVIGPKTGQALDRFGLRSDLVAKEYVGEALAEAILKQGDVRRVLIPRALEAREDLPKLLEASGAEVDVIPAYETRPVGEEQAEKLRAMIEGGEIDVVMFTSGSTVSSTMELLGDGAAALLAKVTVASIGPITTRAAETRGVTVSVTASEYTVEGLLDALEASA